MYSENKLYGKTVIWNGDSICQGSSRWGSWADRIAAKNELTAWKNYGVGGGTIVENAPRMQSGKARHSVCATLEQMHEDYPNADYIVLEGGTNDADLFGAELNTPERLGTFTPDDYSGSYDKSTFCGALESVFYRATKYWKGAKIGYIVAHKMGPKPSDLPRRREYFEKAIAICKKWGIPYIDLWERSYLNPLLEWMYDPAKSTDENVESGSFYADGQHLTAKGYDLLTDIIDPWLNSL